MDTFKTENSPAEHKAVITDVRYRPNSLQVATSSMDKCVRLWDTTNVMVFFLFYCKLCVAHRYDV